jgi:hypothetical protein
VALLATPSLYLVDKYGGPLSLPVYVGCVAVAVWHWQRAVRVTGPPSPRAETAARILACVTWLAVFLAFAVLYPLANSGRFGAGSDSDEALNQATRALLLGRYPYYEHTYLGNAITPMPGGLLYAIPFVLLGNEAYQSLFWLPVAWLALRAAWSSRTREALLFLWLVLTTSPAIMHSVITGSDYIPNALAVLLSSLVLVGPTRQHDGLDRNSTIAAVLFGVALSWRANFVFVIPLIVSRMAQTRGLRAAMILGAAALGSAVAVTLPFFFFDPEHFSPLHTRSKLGVQAGVLYGVLIVAALASALLSHPRANGSTGAFLRNAAGLQAMLVLFGGLLQAARGVPQLAFTSYGLFFEFFGLAAVAATAAGASSPRLGETLGFGRVGKLERT